MKLKEEKAPLVVVIVVFKDRFVEFHMEG